jgi:hypothetical protein
MLWVLVRWKYVTSNTAVRSVAMHFGQNRTAQR